jgi:hypothetical protein
MIVGVAADARPTASLERQNQLPYLTEVSYLPGHCHNRDARARGHRARTACATRPALGQGQGLAGGPDLRAPDQVAPVPAAGAAPDQRASRPLGAAGDSSNRPNIVISKAHKPVADAQTTSTHGRAGTVYVLICLGVALVLLAGG